MKVIFKLWLLTIWRKWCSAASNKVSPSDKNVHELPMEIKNYKFQHSSFQKTLLKFGHNTCDRSFSKVKPLIYWVKPSFSRQGRLSIIPILDIEKEVTNNLHYSEYLLYWDIGPNEKKYYFKEIRTMIVIIYLNFIVLYPKNNNFTFAVISNFKYVYIRSTGKFCLFLEWSKLIHFSILWMNFHHYL